VKWVYIALFLYFAAACSSSRPPGANATPLEAAIVVQVRDVQTDADGVDTVLYLPDCGGIAVGQYRILTAAHCMWDRGHALGEQVYYVDASTWRATTQGHALAVFQSADGEVAELWPADPLGAWVRTAAAQDGPAELVHLAGPAIVDTPTMLAGNTLSGPVAHGDSGSGLFQSGALVGIVDTCVEDTGAPGVCLSGSGQWVPL